MSSDTTRSQEEAALSAVRHIPQSMQANRRTSLVPRFVCGVYTRSNVHGRKPITTHRGHQHDPSVPVDERTCILSPIRVCRCVVSVVMQTCTLCDSSGGAVVCCSDCPAEYHVSCAWKAGHKFGFEIQQVSALWRHPPVRCSIRIQVKSSKRDTTTVVEFKDASGCMVPQVTCKGHPSNRRQIFGLCDTNEAGEVSNVEISSSKSPSLTAT